MANNPTHHTIRLSDLINEFQLKQHITSPTRITPSSKILIDIIMSYHSGVIHLGLSDHSLVYICRKVGIPRAEPKIVETKQFKYFNSSAFQYDLKMDFKDTTSSIIMPTQIMRGRYGKLFFLTLQICMLHFGFGKSKVSTVLG
jgi:hypothetical protein